MHRVIEFRPKRRRWPGVLGAGLVGAAMAALAVSSWYEPRTVGQRLDASISATEQSVQRQVDDIKRGAAVVAEESGRAGERLATSVGDAAITAAVKAALATDPALSMLSIEVETHAGVVQLRGPAPDQKSRERAGVLAAAPEGVRSVVNELQLPGTPVAGRI
jgi:osmotically-inducible protein OsmY